MAKLLQRILHIFHPITGSQHSDDNWRQCFTEPNPPDFQLIRLIIFLYLITLLLCVVQVKTDQAIHHLVQVTLSKTSIRSNHSEITALTNIKFK